MDILYNAAYVKLKIIITHEKNLLILSLIIISCDKIENKNENQSLNSTKSIQRQDTKLKKMLNLKFRHHLSFKILFPIIERTILEHCI